MEFADLTPQPEVPIPSTPEPTAEVSDYHDVELEDFMSRPIRIANITWTYGASINGTFDPWNLFFTDTRVKNRLAYYNLMRCKLCVKFVVNGNAFQYGQMFVDYLPLQSYTLNGTALTDTVSPTNTASTIYPNVQTHRQYIKIRPLDSQGACFELPYFWQNNYLSIPLEEWKYMGDLRYYTVNPVKHANNAAATDPPIITVFAWAEDLVLGVPTASPPATLLPQSGLEYLPRSGTEVIGKISGPATSLATFAGSMATTPFIGKYAMATSMMASGIGAIAKMFGFSRPPIETPVAPMAPDFVGNIANVDRPENIKKLTTDSSQEVTIDPTVTGISMGDELSISSIASKETYFTQFTWDYSQGADSSLFHTKVTPLLHGLVPGYAVTPAIYPTALEFASLPFKYWRGTLKFRFEVIASKFHRGRLRFMYDPSAVPVVTDFNKNYQTVLDLDSSTDLEIKVHWAQPQAACEVGGVSLSSVNYGAAFTAPTASQHNGGIYVYVLNNLAVPSQDLLAAQCLVYVNVYVSACDDFEVFVPDDTNIANLTMAAPFIPAAGKEYLPCAGVEGTSVWEVGQLITAPKLDVIMFGEKITTFRSLLKRYAQYTVYYLAGIVGATYYRVTVPIRRVPLCAGSDPNGINSVANLLGLAGNYPANDIKQTLIQYLSFAYSGSRGSYRYKYQSIPIAIDAYGKGLWTVTRSFLTRSSPSSQTGIATNSTSDAMAKFLRSDWTWNGSALVNIDRNPLLEIEDPYYVNLRFLNPKTYLTNANNLSGGHTLTAYVSGSPSQGMVVKSYVSTGEDFNLMYYTGPGYLWTSAYY